MRVESIYKSILSFSATAHVGRPTGEFFSAVENQQGSWYLDRSCGEQLAALYQKIRNAFPGISEDEIEDVVEDGIAAVLFAEKEFTIEYLTKKINELTGRIKNREFCIAVFGMEIEEGCLLTFGNINFHPMSYASRYVPEGLPDRGYCWASYQGEGTLHFVEEEGTIQVNQHIQAIAYLYNFENEYPYSSNTFLRTSHNDSVDSKSFTLARIKGQANFSNAKRMFSPDSRTYIVLKKELIEKWRDNVIFNKLKEILQSKGAIQRRILTAISFLHDAVNERDIQVTILKNVIGMEAILGDPEDNHQGRISSNLAEKIAFLLETDIKKRLQVIRQIKNLYKIRSGIGHGSGSKEMDPDDLYYQSLLSGDFLIHIITGFIKLFGEKDGFTVPEDINKWFLMQKMG